MTALCLTQFIRFIEQTSSGALSSVGKKNRIYSQWIECWRRFISGIISIQQCFRLPNTSIHPPSLSIALPSAMIVGPIRGSVVTKDVRSSLYGRKFLDRLRADWEIMEFFCCILLGMGFKVKLFRASWKCFRATGHTFREPINTSIITLTRRGG